MSEKQPDENGFFGNIGLAGIIIISMVSLILLYLCFNWIKATVEQKMRERRLDKYKHEFYSNRESEMKALLMKGVSIGRVIEKELPSMEAEMHDTEILEDPDRVIQDQDHIDKKPVGNHEFDYLTTLQRLDVKQTHPLIHSIKNYKYLSLCVELEMNQQMMKNKMTGSSLMAQRLSNPFVDQEYNDQSKPGPILSNGKRIKIKDMTKKKKKQRMDSKNSDVKKVSKGDSKLKRKDNKQRKKQTDADNVKDLQDDINYVFGDEKQKVQLRDKKTSRKPPTHPDKQKTEKSVKVDQELLKIEKELNKEVQNQRGKQEQKHQQKKQSRLQVPIIHNKKTNNQQVTESQMNDSRASLASKMSEDQFVNTTTNRDKTNLGKDDSSSRNKQKKQRAKKRKQSSSSYDSASSDENQFNPNHFVAAKIRN